MLNFIYYPVSAILSLWHDLFAIPFGADTASSWVLAVVFVVVTLRLLLYVPYLHQVRYQRAMVRLQPQIQAIQRKHKDRARQAEELQKLTDESGLNLLAGCLPALAQGIVFIGLFHVLRSFNPPGPNYFFDTDGVRSFLTATFFGHSLNATLISGAWIAIPLMIAAAVLTHLTARASIARSNAQTPQAELINRLTLWVLPVFAVVGGPFLPITVLIYWATSYAWTLAQQHVVNRVLDKELLESVRQ